MVNYSYKEIITKAETCKKSVEKEYKIGISTKWTYYICRAIIKPKRDISKITFDKAPSPAGDYISRQIPQKDYLKLSKYLIEFVEKNKRLPNYISWGSYKIRPALYVYMFSRILVYYNKHEKLANNVNVNSKCFTKPIETGNTVYDNFCNKVGKKFTTIDEVLVYLKNHGKYSKYFDDKRSNKQISDSLSGNCVDLLQWLINMAIAMGYDWKCLHVQCRKSGTGHVRGQFRHKKHTKGNWINRDPAAVANGEPVTSIWCSDGILIATNPSWFLENLNR